MNRWASFPQRTWGVKARCHPAGREGLSFILISSQTTRRQAEGLNGHSLFPGPLPPAAGHQEGSDPSWHGPQWPRQGRGCKGSKVQGHQEAGGAPHAGPSPGWAAQPPFMSRAIYYFPDEQQA